MNKIQKIIIGILIVADAVLTLFNIVLGFLGLIILFVLVCNFKFNGNIDENTEKKDASTLL